MASLLYGSGLRLMECTRLRVRTSTATSSSCGTGRRQRPHHHAPGSACRALEDASGQGRRAAQEGPLGGFGVVYLRAGSLRVPTLLLRVILTFAL